MKVEHLFYNPFTMLSPKLDLLHRECERTMQSDRLLWAILSNMSEDCFQRRLTCNSILESQWKACLRVPKPDLEDIAE